MPGLWKKYEPCRALLVPMSPLFAYASHVLTDESLGWQALYSATLMDNCDMVVMVFMQRVHPEDDIIKSSIPGFDLWMQSP